MITQKAKWLIPVLIIFISSLNGQTKKYKIFLNYSPNFSKVTNGSSSEKYKLSHQGIMRVEFDTKRSIKPTLGLGFLNNGEKIVSDIDGQFGIDKVKFIYNYNYLYMPFGVKINRGRLFLLPEIGLGLNISNTKKRITEFSNGEIEREVKNEDLNALIFNKYPFISTINIGREFHIKKMVFTLGLRGFYGLSQVIKQVPRDYRIFGFGISIGAKIL